MKGKESITIKVNQKLKELCLKYGVEPEQLMIQFQKDMVSGAVIEPFYPKLLAELYLAEYIAKTAKVDRSAVESVLNYLRSYSQQRKNKQPIPKELSKTTKRILKECSYRKKHSKN